jgi:lysophospholipase L1-like esterase
MIVLLRRLVPLLASLFFSCNLETDETASGGGGNSGGSAANRTILAFGDSLTSGGGKISDPYPGQLSRMTGRPVVSSGAGGETIPRGAARFNGVFDRTKPGVVVIMEGTNDAAAGTSLAAAEAALEQMVVYAKSKGAGVVLATIPPFQKATANADPRAQSVNERIRAVASRQRVALADVHKAFGNNGALTQGDGIHLTNEGSTVVAATVADRL